MDEARRISRLAGQIQAEANAESPNPHRLSELADRVAIIADDLAEEFDGEYYGEDDDEDLDDDGDDE